MIAALAQPPHRTAEWQCTKCSVTNRKLVPKQTAVTDDRCLACHAKHLVWVGTRPVRWNAEAR
ncbi:MAG: hypothetical protein FJ206_06630 [Gemmatimonadetes bacterium]|nr:hypothetical protein [Gemmatimonadota bacterium]